MLGYRKLSDDEYNGGKPFPYNKTDFQNLPSEIDWRIAGAVTAVKGKVFISNTFFKLLFVIYIIFVIRSINLWFLLEFWYYWYHRRSIFHETP